MNCDQLHRGESKWHGPARGYVYQQYLYLIVMISLLNLQIPTSHAQSPPKSSKGTTTSQSHQNTPLQNTIVVEDRFDITVFSAVLEIVSDGYSLSMVNDTSPDDC